MRLILVLSLLVMNLAACGSGELDPASTPVLPTPPSTTVVSATTTPSVSVIRVATTPDAPSSATLSCRQDLLPYMTAGATDNRSCELHDSEKYWLHFSDPDTRGVLRLQSVTVILFFTDILGSAKNCADIEGLGILWNSDTPVPTNAFRAQCDIVLLDLNSPGTRVVKTLAPLPDSAIGRWLDGQPCSNLPVFYGGRNDNPTPLIAECLLTVRS
jgi:hypothetical protein